MKEIKNISTLNKVPNKSEIDNLISIINTIRYGSVTVIIQDGQIVQIEKNEKLRIK